VGRRIAVVIVLALAAPAGGAVNARTTPVAPTARDTPILAHVTSKARHRRAPLGTLVALVRPGREALVRSAPNGPVIARVSSRTEFGSPQTFAVTRVLPARRYRVVSMLLPNGRAGWIDAAPGTFKLSRTKFSLDIDLSSRTLRVRPGGRVMRIGIGAPGTPTPSGRFAITDKLNGAAYSPVYGCCILALSGHQTNLPRGWTGGDRLAIHGGSTAGAVSTGCLHAATADLHYLMRVVPLGALVVIHP
jgi:hypothetical protein